MKTINFLLKNYKKTLLLFIIIYTFSFNSIYAQLLPYDLYPAVYDSIPKIDSPFSASDSLETVLVITKSKDYGIVPVTLENGKPLLYSKRLGTYLGKYNQKQVAAGDFPELAKTGLHSHEQLDNKRMITGIPIDVITCTARPNAYSYSGFLADDEDIISVLKGDNSMVKSLELTHPQLAKPLFHIWNIILKETELGNWARFYDNIKYIFYNDKLLNFRANSTKGWQVSIFDDEVQGRYDIHVDRDFTADEESYLTEKYSYLNFDEMTLLKNRISSLDFSEMLPYYILLYGFYEGHTDYRCDPIAISFIFGLQSLEEIDIAFESDLYNVLTKHYFSSK